MSTVYPRLFSRLRLPLMIMALGVGAAGNLFAAVEHDEHEDHDHHDEQEAHSNHHEHGDHDDEEGTHVSISPEMAEQSGITLSTVESGTIERHIRVFGRLVSPPSQQAAVAARFPGLIKEVRHRIGDRVAKGDRLATIESNESLQDYTVLAPISGVIQAQSGNVGEMTGPQPLFRLVDDRNFWAELKIFPSQRFEVAPGQSVHIVHNRHEHDSQLQTVAPAGEGQPYVIARVELVNRDGDMAPGDLVSAEIDAEILAVNLVVDNRALQDLDGTTVVFVKEGDQFEARPVVLGRTDGRHTEITAGVNAGEQYVVSQSYLIKADIEKSGAAHEH